MTVIHSKHCHASVESHVLDTKTTLWLTAILPEILLLFAFSSLLRPFSFSEHSALRGLYCILFVKCTNLFHSLLGTLMGSFTGFASEKCTKSARSGDFIVCSSAFAECGGHFSLSVFGHPGGGLNHMLCQEWSQTKPAESSFSSVWGALENFLGVTKTFPSNLLIPLEDILKGQKHFMFFQ